MGKRMVPIKKDLFTADLVPLEQVRLKGSRCRVCSEVFLGQRLYCENCGAPDLEDLALSQSGVLYSYTIARNRPPGNYVGPDPFQPFAIGLVELPEGLRILAPLTDCDLENLQIGVRLELKVQKAYEDAEGNDVVGYWFRPV